MKPRMMRDVAIVQRRGSTITTDGEPDTTWTTLVTTRCAVAPMIGQERYTASGQGSEANFKIRIRYQDKLSDFNPTDRLSVRGVLYDVESIIDVDNKHRELVVLCSVLDRDN